MSQNPKFSPQDLVDLALEDQSAEYKAKVLTVAFRAKIEPNDPLFLVLLATGRLELMLLDAPKTLKHIFDNNLQKASDIIEGSGKAALLAQKSAIAGAVNALVSKSARQNEENSVKASSTKLVSVLKFSGAVLLSLLIGGFLGKEIAIGNQGGYVGQVKLTAQQADALGWAQSNEGKFARDLMRWNWELLDKKQCKSEAAALGVTLEIDGKKAQSGFCTLWVEPPNARKFAQAPAKTQIKKKD